MPALSPSARKSRPANACSESTSTFRTVPLLRVRPTLRVVKLSTQERCFQSRSINQCSAKSGINKAGREEFCRNFPNTSGVVRWSWETPMRPSVAASSSTSQSLKPRRPAEVAVWKSIPGSRRRMPFLHSDRRRPEIRLHLRGTCSLLLCFFKLLV